MHPTTNDPRGDRQIRMDKLAEQVAAYLSQDDREAALSACKQMLQLNDRYNQAHMLMAKVMMPGPNYANCCRACTGICDQKPTQKLVWLPVLQWRLPARIRVALVSTLAPG